MFYNYWTDRISFKEILQNKLLPLLKKKYANVKVKADFIKQINIEASNFVANEFPDDFILFPFQINLECDDTIIDNISITLSD